MGETEKVGEASMGEEGRKCKERRKTVTKIDGNGRRY
jgi:hypothetical protein